MGSPVHHPLLMWFGTAIVETRDLEQLAATARKRKRYGSAVVLSRQAQERAHSWGRRTAWRDEEFVVPVRLTRAFQPIIRPPVPSVRSRFRSVAYLSQYVSTCETALPTPPLCCTRHAISNFGSTERGLAASRGD